MIRNAEELKLVWKKAFNIHCIRAYLFVSLLYLIGFLLRNKT